MEQEFRGIYYKYHPRLFRVAYYILKEKDAAEDVCQDVFLKLWDRRGSVGDIESMEAYLIQMTRNMALNHLESSKREERLQLELSWDAIKINETESAPENDKLKTALEKAVSQLSPQCRLIFSLSRFEGLTNEEIASYLDISKRTVETQISLALKRFRTDLKPLFASLLIAMAVLFTFFS
ncbi:MAG: RNA polymerase sigma-70 factor [Cyclobacteriaceae bacterium]